MSKRLAAIVAGLVLSLAVTAAPAEIVVVVSSESPVERLTRAQLADIYLGNLSRFPSGEPAIPIDQAERAPAHDAFYREYLDRTPAQIKAHWSKRIFTGRGQPPRAVPDGNAVADIVADDPRAIGYVDSELVDDRLQVVTIE